MPASKRAFVVGMIRRLRQFGPLARRRQTPRQQQPDLLRLEYYKALLPFVHAFRLPDSIRREILADLRDKNQQEGRMDSPWWDRWRHRIDIEERNAEDEIGKRRLEDTAKRFGERVSSFQREQLDRQTRAALGVPLRMIEAPTVEKLSGFAQENVELIKSVSSRYYDRIREDVETAFAEGWTATDLAEQFEERDGMAERDARRIARDQIGKLNAQFNEERQKDLGITAYIWRTANDERVRDEHQEREGKEYTWADPPEDGNPGEPIQCRCYAEPNFEQILGDLTE